MVETIWQPREIVDQTSAGLPRIIKFAIHIPIHIYRFSVDIQGYLDRQTPIPHTCSPKILQNTAVQKRLFPLPLQKNMAQTFSFRNCWKINKSKKNKHDPS